MKMKLLAVLLAAGGTMFAADISIGIQIGAPPPPRIIAVRPVAPGPDFAWIEGYWYPVSGHYRWHEGYWSRPPYDGAVWVAPHHDGERFYAGYWNGDHGRRDHDHRWDRGHDRDWGHEREDHDHGRGRGRGHDRD